MRYLGTTSAAIVAGAATAAGAAFVEIETPIVVQQDSTVSAELVGAWAAAAGDVYFLGAATPGGGFSASMDTGQPGLGQRLFNSKEGAGATADLGTFTAGSELYFGYHITKGYREIVQAGDVFRSNEGDDLLYFGWDESASGDDYFRLGWEDTRDPKRSDWDYRDVVFDITMTPVRGEPVPAPGAAVLLALSTGAAAARRRR